MVQASVVAGGSQTEACWKYWVMQCKASSQFGPYPELEARSVAGSYVYALPCQIGVAGARARLVQVARRRCMVQFTEPRFDGCGTARSRSLTSWKTGGLLKSRGMLSKHRGRLEQSLVANCM